MRKARTGQSRAMAGSASSRGSACKFTTWSLKGVVGTLGTYPGRGLRTTWESAGPNSRHESSTENACRSPTLLTEANAVRSTVFKRQKLRLYWLQRLKGLLLQGHQDRGEIPRGYQMRARRDLNLLAPLRNLMTKSCFPTDLPSTASWCAAIAATYTLRVEGDSLRSNPSCRKEEHDRDRASPGVFPAGRNTSRRTGSTSACKRVL